MKKIVINCLFVLFLFLSSDLSFGQAYYVYAVNTDGKRFGRYNVNDNLVSAVTDTISLTDARKIVGINAVRGSKLANEQGYVLVQGFNLTIEEDKDSRKYMSNNDLLTPEMRKHLLSIDSGTLLLFTDIVINPYDSKISIQPQSITYFVK